MLEINYFFPIFLVDFLENTPENPHSQTFYSFLKDSFNENVYSSWKSNHFEFIFQLANE
jgi:hypothetical protein